MSEKTFDSPLIEPDQAAAPRVPLETYLTVKTRAELEAVHRICTKPLWQAMWKTLLVFAVGALLTSLICREDDLPWLSFYLGAFLVYCSVQGATLRNQKKRFLGDVARTEKSSYLTEIFEDGYRVTVTRGNEEVLRFFTAWDSVQGAWRTPEYLIFYNHFMTHYLPVAELPADSHLFTALSGKLKPQKRAEKSDEQTLSGRLQKLSVLFAVLTALSLAASLAIFPMMLWMPHSRSLPIYALFLIFPLLCLIFDGIWNRGGKNRKSNRILCILSIVIITVLAVGVFFLSGVLDDLAGVEDPTPAYDLAQNAEIDLPSDLSMIYSVETPEPADLAAPTRIYYHGVLDVEDKTAAFAEQVKSDSRWLSPLPTELRGLLPDFATSNTDISDYVLFYRMDEQTYNELPREEGCYRYLCFVFHEKSGLLEVYHYDLICTLISDS